MGEYTSSTEVRLAPAELFDYLSDVEHLPKYVPGLTTARQGEGDKVEVTAHIDPPDQPEQDVQGEAWMKINQADRSLEWGAAGPDDYSGELVVESGTSPGSSLLTVKIRTVHVEGRDLQDGVDDAVVGIKRNVEEVAR